jgi:hypothetical protein
MFAAATVAVLSVAVLYALTTARVPDSEAASPAESVPTAQPVPVAVAAVDVAANGSARSGERREVTRCSS